MKDYIVRATAAEGQVRAFRLRQQRWEDSLQAE